MYFYACISPSISQRSLTIIWFHWESYLTRSLLGRGKLLHHLHWVKSLILEARLLTNSADYMIQAYVKMRSNLKRPNHSITRCELALVLQRCDTVALMTNSGSGAAQQDLFYSQPSSLTLPLQSLPQPLLKDLAPLFICKPVFSLEWDLPFLCRVVKSSLV